MGKLKILGIQLLIGVILLEIVLRCLYFQKLGNDTFAIVSAIKSVRFRATDNYRDRLIKNHNLLRPVAAKVNADIVDEVIESNSFEYAPWVDFKLQDYAGKYVNSKGFLRRSVPPFSDGKTDDTLSIYFFGGSTMFGFDVTDEETIPSQFVDIYKESCDSCKTLEVFNYGVLSYYSYNELMLFHQLLATNHRPKVVVFLDGLNDLFIIQAARKRVPWFYFRLKENIQNSRDSTLSLFQLTTNESAKSAVDEVVQNYKENISHIQKLSEAYHITPFFFIQPNVYYNYPNVKKDSIADTSRNVFVNAGYPLLRTLCDNDTTNALYFLGDMLADEDGHPFIDEIHYSPDMNRKIAAEMFKRLRASAVF